MRNKIKELEERIEKLEKGKEKSFLGYIATLEQNFSVIRIRRLKLQSELHNEIANRLEVECQGDKSTLTAYMNFIYRLKTLQDDIDLYVAYGTLPENMGVLIHTQEKDFIRPNYPLPLFTDEPNLIRRRLERYNDYLYFDELTEESFKNGYYVEYQGDYFWEENDIPYQDKYKELIKCILNLLLDIQSKIKYYVELRDIFPKLVKLIERNKKVCQDKLKELENKE